MTALSHATHATLDIHGEPQTRLHQLPVPQWREGLSFKLHGAFWGLFECVCARANTNPQGGTSPLSPDRRVLPF
jgi:hypothetical protein